MRKLIQRLRDCNGCAERSKALNDTMQNLLHTFVGRHVTHQNPNSVERPSAKPAHPANMPSPINQSEDK
jgi:hypothetical protein